MYFVIMEAIVLGWTPIAAAISEFSMPLALMSRIFARCTLRYSPVCDLEIFSTQSYLCLQCYIAVFFISTHGCTPE